MLFASMLRCAAIGRALSFRTRSESSVLVSSSAATLSCIRRYMPLPADQSQFSAYPELDIPSESRIDAIRRAGLATHQHVWIGTEKIHGTNFGVFLIDEKTVRFAKRSGMMDPNENFFGYHSLIDTFTAQLHILLELVKRKYGLAHIGRLVMNGELFGCRYDHPQVPKTTKWCTMPNGKKFPLAGVLIQQESFPQYSPELHFYCFDMRYSVSGKEEDFRWIPFDEMCSLAQQVPSLLYSRALVRGTLDQCLAFDVENFVTPIPALLGLGNFPLEGNYAEGIVIKHTLRGTPQIDNINIATVIKVRCSAFMEMKHPTKQRELKETFFDTIRASSVKVAGDQIAIAENMLPQVEAAANAVLLNLVSDGRLSNVVSKIGVETLGEGATTQKDLTLLLAKDALKDFLKEVDCAVINTSVAFRKTLLSSCYREAQKIVEKNWERYKREGEGKRRSDA